MVNIKKTGLILLLLVAVLACPSVAMARNFIGDELPASKYQVGTGPDIDLEIQSDNNGVPVYKPAWADNLIWMSYPHSAYYFRSAPSEGAGWFAGKISDATAVLENGKANLAFQITKFCVFLGNMVLLVSFDNFILEKSLKFIGESVRAIGAPVLGGAGNLTSLLLIFAIFGLGLGIAVLLFRGQIIKAMTNLLIAVLCLGALLAYVVNVDRVLPPLLAFFDDVAGLAVTAGTLVQPSNVQPLPGNEDITIEDMDFQNLNAKQESLCNLTNQTWFALVSGPWAAAQFGTADYRKLKMTQAEKDKVNDAIKPSILAQIAPKSNNVRNTRLASDYIDTNYLASGEDVKDPLLSAITAPDIDHGQHDITRAASGPGAQNAAKHSWGAFFSMLPAGLYLIFACLCGLPVFVSKIALTALLVFVVFALLLGIAGDRGRLKMLEYFSWLLQALSVQVVYGFYIGIVMMLATVMMKLAGTGIGIAGFLLSVVFIMAIKFRNRYYSLILGLLSLTPAKEVNDNPLKTFLKHRMLEQIMRTRALNQFNKNNNEGEKEKQENDPGAEERPAKTLKTCDDKDIYKDRPLIIKTARSPKENGENSGQYLETGDYNTERKRRDIKANEGYEKEGVKIGEGVKVSHEPTYSTGIAGDADEQDCLEQNYGGVGAKDRPLHHEQDKKLGVDKDKSAPQYQKTGPPGSPLLKYEQTSQGAGTSPKEQENDFLRSDLAVPKKGAQAMGDSKINAGYATGAGAPLTERTFGQGDPAVKGGEEPNRRPSPRPEVDISLPSASSPAEQETYDNDEDTYWDRRKQLNARYGLDDEKYSPNVNPYDDDRPRRRLTDY